MKTWHRFWIPALWIGFVLAGATCGGPSGVAPSDCGYIADPQTRWEHCGPSSYTALEQRSCFCPGLKSWTVVVQDGVVVDAIPDPGTPGDPEALRNEALARAWTVEQMFERIAVARVQAEHVDEHYDDARGYPAQVYVDNRVGVADDELSYRMADLTPVTDPGGNP